MAKSDYPEGTLTQKQLVGLLRAVRRDLRKWKEDETDVRLRVHDGESQLAIGDASFDTDHRGYIGASSVSADASTAALEDIARNLREQVAEAWALDRSEASAPSP